ncbi:MAG: hypothetical protein Q8O76_00435 [Chloroflexota bacterium]|nr:hypothetical protein [Chloroflexota bacterium]
MDYQDIIIEKGKGITTVRLNRPQAMNAVSRRMNSEIRSAI